MKSHTVKQLLTHLMLIKRLEDEEAFIASLNQCRVRSHTVNLLIAALINIAVNSTTLAQDTDGDGIPDQIEQQLLNMYRPWLYYDHDETVWPCSATWFVQHSSLINNPSCDDIPESAL